MQIHHVYSAYFAQKVVTVSITFSEIIYTWLIDEKPINYKISDMNFHR